MEDNKKSSYRSIFKATSLFGGLQVYQILIGIIRSKFIAVLLGPAGMGISGLYTSATSLIKSLSSMGLQSSAVRDVAAAYGSGDTERINRTISVLRKLVWITGLLGMIIVLIGSPILSKTTFGSYDYTIPFIFLSVTLLLDQLSVAQNVILQGTRKLKHLAKSSAIGSTLGLLVTIPLYYLFGVEGIVPTLIIYSFISFLLAWYFARKVSFKKVVLTSQKTIQEGRTMLKMGIAMSVNALLLSVSAYFLRIFILHHGGQDAVGLFTAGFAIMTTYVGMIFSAISTDYYPRLAAVNDDNEKSRDVINQQGEIGLLIIAPCLVVCIVFMPLIVHLLYSEEFLPANDYILWACVGTLFKLVSWVISYLFIAKSAMKIFLKNEILVTLYSLLLSIVGYYIDGLRGLGIAFTLQYVFYFLQVGVVANRKYGYKLSKDFLILLISQLALVLSSLLVATTTSGYTMYVCGSLIILVTALYSYSGLNKRMDINQFIKSKFKK